MKDRLNPKLCRLKVEASILVVFILSWTAFLIFRELIFQNYAFELVCYSIIGLYIFIYFIYCIHTQLCKPDYHLAVNQAEEENIIKETRFPWRKLLRICFILSTIVLCFLTFSFADSHTQSGATNFDKSATLGGNFSFINVPPINGWLVLARTGSGYLNAQFQAFLSEHDHPTARASVWPKSTHSHDHTRTMADLENVGARSVFASIRRPSERMESFARLKWDLHMDMTNLFVMIVGMLNEEKMGVWDGWSDNQEIRGFKRAFGWHFSYLFLLQPLQYYLSMEGRHPNHIEASRVVWICTNRLSAHLQAITGLDDSADISSKRAYNCSNWLHSHPKLLPTECPSGINCCTFSERKATPHGKGYLFSEEQRSFIDRVLFKNETEFYEKLCENESEGPMVTDGKGEILGKLGNTPGLAIPWVPYYVKHQGEHFILANEGT